MILDLGPGLIGFLGTLLTTFGGVAVLLLTQRAQAAKIAATLALTTADHAADIKRAVERDGLNKDAQLSEIHHMVNSRLSQALEEIIALKAEVAKLKAIINKLGGQGDKKRSAPR